MQLTAATPAPAQRIGQPKSEFESPSWTELSHEAELRILCTVSTEMMHGEAVELETLVTHMGREMPLWEGLKSSFEACLFLLAQIDCDNRDRFIHAALSVTERATDEAEGLVLQALARPVGSRAIARIVALGLNFIRSLDMCFEALLRFPSQKSIYEKPRQMEVVIDWAVGGIAEWMAQLPYTFSAPERSKKLPQFRHMTRHHAVDPKARPQISYTEIANMFMTEPRSMMQLERASLKGLADAFGSSGVVMDFLGDDHGAA